MSGNKDELIYKCADGATLGRIPRCPNCFGGRYFLLYTDPNSIIKKEPISVQATETIPISTIAIQVSAKQTSKETLGTTEVIYSLYILSHTI